MSSEHFGCKEWNHYQQEGFIGPPGRKIVETGGFFRAVDYSLDLDDRRGRHI